MAGLVKVEYVGPLGEVTLPVLGVTAKVGEPFEVSTDAAEGLLAQVDNFREVKASKTVKEG